jgi:transposase-like protein
VRFLFQTIGDIGRQGLELHVYCPSCRSTRRPVDLERWADRCFATARFRCSGTRYNGLPCRAIGMPVIRPAELLPVGGPVTLPFLTCPRCIWEINQAQLDKPPWSGSRQRYRCPGCAGRVDWQIHGPAWRPGRQHEHQLAGAVDPVGRDQLSRSEGLDLGASRVKSWAAGNSA